MEYNCKITIDDVNSKKEFMDILQIMLDDYQSNNQDYDYHDIIINIGKKVA